MSLQFRSKLFRKILIMDLMDFRIYNISTEYLHKSGRCTALSNTSKLQ